MLFLLQQQGKCRISTNVLLMATAVCKINSAALKMYVNCVQIKCQNR